MPRIDPLKLLSCLGVLLAPNGGILSSNEVQRLASLMARYSKKLVSKCIYIHILKCTETELLGQFMAAGGWTLTHVWLQDGITTFNWPFVQELLEMLLMCPVDGNRLKTNSAPKLVKNLSQSCPHTGVRILATKLVEQWLKIARQETQESAMNQKTQLPFDSQSNASSLTNNSDPSIAAINGYSSDSQTNSAPDNSSANQVSSDNDKNNNDNENLKSDLMTNETLNSNPNLSPSKESLVFKISKKNGKQVIETVIKPVEVATVSDNVDSVEKTDTVQEDPLKETTEMKKPEKKKDRERKDSSSDSGSTSSKDKEKTEKSEKSNKIEKSKESKEKDKESDREKEKDKERSRKSSSSHHKSSSSSKSSSRSSSSHKSSSSSSKSSSSKSSSSSREKERDRDRDKSKDKDRKSSSSSSSKHSSSKSRDKEKERRREDKEKKDDSQAEKDKDTLAKVFSSPMAKLGKIPKKVHSESTDSSPTKENKDKDKDKSKDMPKKTISIEVRKGDKPKTVKTLNSQFRNHGLAEEAPPPPSRKTLKKPSSSPSSGTVTSPTTTSNNNSLSSTSSNHSHSNPLKRTSPPPSKYVPPEKKIKDDPIPDREGGIKLIKPKPFLIESDFFMDDLKSSTHKTVKKRKRLTSQTSIEAKPKTEAESPKIKSEPPQFYKDTLEEAGDDSKKNSEDNNEKKSEAEGTEKVEKMEVDEEPKETSETTEKDEKNNVEVVEDNEPEIPVKRPPGIGCGVDGPPGVLMIHRRKGPKKQLKWKPQEELEDVRYFELDETERVNVTKTFIEKKQLERFDERNAFVLGRKMQTDDTMVEQTPWRPLKIVDDVPVYAYGSKSREKKIQGERESSVLQSLFFTSVPDSADEPDFENHDYNDPQVIPLDDLTGNPDAVNDFTNIPWPEPKPDTKDSPHMMQAFSSVFTNLPGAPNMLAPAFVNPGVAALRGATPFANPAIWNMNLNMNQMNPLAAMPPMMNDGLLNGGVNVNPPSLLETLPFPFGAPGQLNNMNNMNGMRNPPNNVNNRPRDRDDRRPFNRDNNWRNDRPSNGPNRSNGGNRNDWIHNNRKVCHQFQQKGYCRNGDNCNYSHSPKF